MSKLNMMVCPHDTAKKPERWFRFIQYLNHHLTTIVHLNISFDFKDFHEHLSEADLVYANPADGVSLMKQGYKPLVRSSNLYDEVVFVAHPEVTNVSIESYQGAKVATVTSMLATKVALHFLGHNGIKPLELINKDSWLGVVNAVAKKEVPLGFIYKDTYDELSDKTKEMVNAFATSQEKLVFHGIYLGPRAEVYRADLEKILLNMNLDQGGRDVLLDLNIEAWKVIADQDLQQLYQMIG